MGAFATRITSDEYAMADGIVIDEGGIDVLLDDEQVIAVSFEGLNVFDLMRQIIPEDRVKPEGVSEEDFLKDIAECRQMFTETSREELLVVQKNGEADIINSLVALSLVNAELAK